MSSATTTTTQILDAAGQVFAQKGYRQATVREICARAGANIAAVNYHFGDKERLYIEAVKSARLAIEDQAPLPDSVDQGDPEEALRVIINILAQRILSPDVESWRHRLLVREFTNPSRACEEIMQESIVPFMNRLHGILRRLLPEGVPTGTVRRLGFSIVSQVAYYRLQDRVVSMMVPPEELARDFGVETLAEHISRFSLAAIRGFQTQPLPQSTSSTSSTSSS